jgi:alpha-glucosidase
MAADVAVPPQPDESWWRHAVTYQIYPRSFADADGDGVGDLRGITSRLPHLRDLGVDAVWISPFYTSPQHDHGYDVADYCDVDPLFGTLADADELITTAHELGLRVIVDLVPNHTSSEHAWFQAALTAAPGSPERARYIFRDGRGKDGSTPPNNWHSVFGGPAWTRVTEPDGTPGQWYLHLFDASQPDLDWRNPEVPEMFDEVLRFWLDRGADGFRVDVAHGLLKEETLRDQILGEGEEPGSDAAAGGAMVERTQRDEPMWDQPEVHDVYRRWRRLLDTYDNPGRVLVAEAWTQTTESMARFVRDDEMHQAFNFAWLLADWSAEQFEHVITSTLDALSGVSACATWVLSNHDVVRHPTRYGGGEVGLARARAATLTMLALPGSAYVYQGEELGLEQVDVAPEHRQDPTWLRTLANGGVGDIGRDGCRVPMPWEGTKPPYGFGPGSGQPWLPQPDEWARLTVEAQTGVPGSTLEFYRSALAARRDHALAEPETIDMLAPGEDVLAFTRGRLTVVLNCGRDATELPAGDIVLASGELEGRLLPPDTAVWLRS